MSQKRYFAEQIKVDSLPEPKWEVITPNAAKQYLAKLHPDQRGKKFNSIDQYARDMKNGAWIISHQGIAFDEDGFLIDGQQRLNAVVNSNVPVAMLVTRGLPKELMRVIDQGSKRTTKDSLRMDCDADASNPVLNASKSVVMPAISTLCKLTMHISLSENDRLYLYSKFKHEFDATQKVCELNGKYSMNAAAVAAVLCATICGCEYEALTLFAMCFCGIPIGNVRYNTDIVFDWRQQIEDVKSKHTRFGQEVMLCGTQQAIYDFINTNEKVLFIPNRQRYDCKEKLIRAINGDREEKK